MTHKKTVTLFRMVLACALGMGFFMSTSVFAEVSNKPKHVRQERAVFHGTPKRIAVEPREGLMSQDVTRVEVQEFDIPPPKRRARRPISLDGWKFNSTGGISYKNPEDTRYWMELTGVLRLDETIFSGSYRDRDRQFPNSGFVRLIETYLESGLGENLLSNIGLTYFGDEIRFTDSWIGYTGFADNNEVNIGRHSGNWFGIENSSGTTWNPFMERSLQANAFYPGDGIGLLTDWWWSDGQLTLVATQPDHGTHFLGANNQPYRSDRWRGIARATYAPIHQAGNVWHFGVSAAYRKNDSSLNGIALSEVGLVVGPGLRSRNLISPLLNTGTIRASYGHQFNVEAARQCGPLLLEAEISEVFVRRVASPLGSSRFHGWNIQGRYLLTGEHHEYDVRDGAFGKVNINSPYGAYELAARYDFINLNDRTLRGGSQHNFTLGFNWFINQQLRFTINYIRASIHPRNDAYRRNLDMFGMRLQVRFK